MNSATTTKNNWSQSADEILAALEADRANDYAALRTRVNELEAAASKAVKLIEGGWDVPAIKTLIEALK